MIVLVDIIDNPWIQCAKKAKDAGKILADALLQKLHGNRPVSLVGYSMGARVIFYCLKELEKQNQYGIVENVILIGAAVQASAFKFATVKKAVAGRFINAYCESDWVLALVHRASAMSSSAIAGLAPIVDEKGNHIVENVNVAHIVQGHVEYKQKLPDVLKYLKVDFVCHKENDAAADASLVGQEEAKCTRS